jgi:hypothetical protein
MSELTKQVITAARNYNRWGRLNTIRYCEKRGIPRRLLTITLQLEAIK